MVSLNRNIVSVDSSGATFSFAFKGMAKIPSPPNQPEVRLKRPVHVGDSSTVKSRLSIFLSACRSDVVEELRHAPSAMMIMASHARWVRMFRQNFINSCLNEDKLIGLACY